MSRSAKIILSAIVVSLLIADVPAVAADADADACKQFTWDVSRELALMATSPQALRAAIKPGSDVPHLQIGKLYELALASQSSVTFVAKPAKPTLDDGTQAGLVQFRVEKAGVYRVSISSGHWIDVLDGSHFVKSRDFQGRHGCERPHKIVEYELPAGRDLTLQLSGAPDVTIVLAITPAPAPAAG